ncbi:hypothetical protein BB559_003523 [Furculomyces boomerangus]|uniref:ERT1/acuK family PAS domain-containing protein n=1 Tax=Furculomyces boomerangus TaxID=61424 RepID=A0A2T9YKV3_9FUNG|nr:hypothetical protein BB559_003523 [Furculomyces boomerangus]
MIKDLDRNSSTKKSDYSDKAKNRPRKKTEKDTVCVKCKITGKICTCRKKKQKVAKYLLEDGLNLDEFKTQSSNPQLAPNNLNNIILPPHNSSEPINEARAQCISSTQYSLLDSPRNSLNNFEQTNSSEYSFSNTPPMNNNNFIPNIEDTSTSNTYTFTEHQPLSFSKFSQPFGINFCLFYLSISFRKPALANICFLENSIPGKSSENEEDVNKANYEFEMFSYLLDSHTASLNMNSDFLVELAKLPDLSESLDSNGRPFIHFKNLSNDINNPSSNGITLLDGNNNISEISDTTDNYNMTHAASKDVSEQHNPSFKLPQTPNRLSNGNKSDSLKHNNDNSWIVGGLTAPNVHIFKQTIRPISNRESQLSYGCLSTIGVMSEELIFRTSKAIAFTRPSILLLKTSFNEEDSIFVERCHQRMILDVERLLEYTGTPTIVWRTSGQISLVGREFTLLTWWKKEELENTEILIFELLDCDSIANYWEKFAVHCFENSDRTIQMTCFVSRPDGSKVHCTCCFTIKRDIFGLPIEVIGSVSTKLNNL